MPQLNGLWDSSLAGSDYTIITVASEGPETMPELRRQLDEYDVRFPVLHYFDGDRGGLFGWEVSRYPSDFLINPQGVVIGRLFHGIDEFTALVELLGSADAAIPLVSLDLSERVNDDGSITATVCVSSSGHQPIELTCGGLWDFQPGGPKIEHMLWDGERYYYRQVEFGEFGDAVFVLEFPSREAVRRFYWWAAVQVPGTELLYGGGGLLNISDHSLRFDGDGVLVTDK